MCPAASEAAEGGDVVFSGIALYSVSHFAVDFACAAAVLARLYGTDDRLWGLLIYNFFAFAVQLPVGMLADRLNRNSLVAALGCVLVAASPYCGALLPFAAGLGNAMFHVGGGIDALNTGRSSALGVFVSAGAPGLFLGTMLGKAGLPLWPVSLALLLLACLIALGLKQRFPENAPAELPAPGRALILGALCLFLVVCLRSFVGLSLNFEWKSGHWSYLVIAAVTLGKAAGGFFAERLGLHRTAVISLGLSLLCFIFANMPVFGVLALFFFNMTMPLTLAALAAMLPGAKGLSFGALTLALFLGFLPVFLGVGGLSPSLLGVLGCAVSLPLMLLGVKRNG